MKCGYNNEGDVCSECHKRKLPCSAKEFGPEKQKLIRFGIDSLNNCRDLLEIPVGRDHTIKKKSVRTRKSQPTNKEWYLPLDVHTLTASGEMNGPFARLSQLGRHLSPLDEADALSPEIAIAQFLPASPDCDLLPVTRREVESAVRLTERTLDIPHSTIDFDSLIAQSYSGERVVPETSRPS